MDVGEDLTAAGLHADGADEREEEHAVARVSSQMVPVVDGEARPWLPVGASHGENLTLVVEVEEGYDSVVLPTWPVCMGGPDTSQEVTIWCMVASEGHGLMCSRTPRPLCRMWCAERAGWVDQLRKGSSRDEQGL